MDDSLSVSSGRGGQAHGKPPVSDLRSQFASDVNAAEPSGFSYASAASANLDASPLSQAPRSGNIFSSVPKAKYNTRTAIIPAAELPRSFNPDRTFLLRLSGPTAVRVTPRDICIALVSEGAMSLDEYNDFTVYYRYESPFERYIHILEGAQFTLNHNSTYLFKPASVGSSSPEVEMRIEDLSIKETTFFLEWVPATFTDQIVRKMLLSVGLRPTSLRRDSRSADKWVVTTTQDPTEVPHYIAAPRFSSDGRYNKTAKILVTIPRRWTECQYCRSTNHRSHRCENKSKKTTMPLIDLTKQREEYPPEFFDSQPRPSASSEWNIAKGRKKSKKDSKKNTQNDRLQLSNRFNFLNQSITDGLDSTTETAGDDDYNWPSQTSTPLSASSSRPGLFRKPDPGTFDFKKGHVNGPKVRLQQKKKNEPVKDATPGKRALRRRGTSQDGEASPATPKRPLRPRLPGLSNENLIGQKKKNSKSAAEGTSKRTRVDPPTPSANVEEPSITVSELASGDADHDSGPGTSSGVRDELVVVPSSVPGVDDILAAGGGSQPFPPLTCSLFDEDGTVDRGEPPDDNSQKESERNIKNVNDNVPHP